MEGNTLESNDKVESKNKDTKSEQSGISAHDLFKDNRDKPQNAQNSKDLESQNQLPKLTISDNSNYSTDGQKDQSSLLSGRSWIAPGKEVQHVRGDNQTVSNRSGKSNRLGAPEKPDTTEKLESPDKPVEKQPLSADGQRLLDLAKNRIPDAGRPNTQKELQQFEKDIVSFEQRAKEQNLSPKETADTYHHVSRLLESQGVQKTGTISERQRIRLAEQVMAKAAEPTSSDQGKNNTCNVTTIENRLYTREPSVPAKVVADLALTGQYTSTDGTTLKMSSDQLRPHGESAENNKRGDGTRTFAGEVFQNAASNMLYAKAKAEGSSLGGFQFKQGESKAVMTYHGDKSKLTEEERGLLGADTPAHAAALNGMIEINKMLTGRDDSNAFLAHSSEKNDISNKANFFSSPAELEAKLTELQKQGQLPAIIAVHTSNEFMEREMRNFQQKQPQRSGRDPFAKSEEGADEPPSAFSDGHVFLVTGIKPSSSADQPAKVSLDDQSGNGLDHGPDKPVSVNDLFSVTAYKPAMHQVKSAENELAELKKMGAPITRKDVTEMFKGLKNDYEGYWKESKPTLTKAQEQDQHEFRLWLKDKHKI